MIIVLSAHEYYLLTKAPRRALTSAAADHTLSVPCLLWTGMCLGPRGGAMTLGGVDRSLIARGGGEMAYVPLLGATATLCCY